MKVSLFSMSINRLSGFITILVLFLFFSTSQVDAHCDSYDGPVIKDAIKALEKNDVDLVLKWVTQKEEDEITS